MSWLDDPGVTETDRPLAALAHDLALDETPWTIAHVRLGEVVDKAGLLAALRAGLAAPDHMGSNWDAVADVLGDRSAPLVVCLDGEVAGSARRDLDVLIDIVDEQTRITRPLTRAIRVRRPD